MFRCLCGALAALLFTPLARADQPAAPAAPAGASVETMLKGARGVIRKTSRLRGLRVRRAIPMAVLSREQLIKQIEQRMGREYTPEEILAEAALLKRLRLIPQGMDYRAEILALMKEQLAGFYDPDTRRLHLADWISLADQEPALAHEICHALQDQHFRLKRLVAPLKENSDRQLAHAALVEGDCTGTMIEFTLIPRGLDLSALPENMDELTRSLVPGERAVGRKDTPLFLRETLAFPYLWGVNLIRSIRAKYPWATVNRMFKRPPQTTEQILHRQKYWRRERAVVIRPRALPALSGYKLVKGDVLGEFQISLILRQAVSREIAARSAAGWGGDLVQLHGRGVSGEPPLLVHLTTWDSDTDAEEFTNAMRHVLAHWRLTPRPTMASGLWAFEEKNGLRWVLQRHEQHVLILGGVPVELVAGLHRDLWERWRVDGQRIRPALWPSEPEASPATPRLSPPAPLQQGGPPITPPPPP